MAMPPDSLPAWSRELIGLYESGAAAQFILHGAIRDRRLIPEPGGAKLGTLEEFLTGTLLSRFDVVLSYDLGNGLLVQKGGETFSKWPSWGERTLPTAPRDATAVITHYLRFCAQVAKLRPNEPIRVAVIVRGAELIAPPAGGAMNHELSAIACQWRDWAADPSIAASHCATFLLVENLSDLHPLVSLNPQAARLALALPDAEVMEQALLVLRRDHAEALGPYAERPAEAAAALVGATLHSVETLLRTRQHRHEPISPADLVAIKKELVEKDAAGLIEFLRPDRTLDSLHGQDAIKQWLRQDIELWRQGDLAALPMGYLFCGPVGTGKTFMVECLAGEAGVPVVKMKNFRDRWVGSTEANLEKIFRLLDSLGRCLVFVDEADQALGRRQADSGDSGVSGRVYGMMAERMSDSRQRGRVMWVLATSRPDLVEVDLKRPGRVDVKIPLFPTATPEEGYALVRALAKRRGVVLPEMVPAAVAGCIPDLLTPGAAEALSVKLYRLSKTGAPSAEAALVDALDDYQAPVPLKTLQAQIALAVAEATDLSFVPERFRGGE